MAAQRLYEPQARELTEDLLVRHDAHDLLQSKATLSGAPYAVRASAVIHWPGGRHLLSH
jgi:hypothetical protein